MCRKCWCRAGRWGRGAEEADKGGTIKPATICEGNLILWGNSQKYRKPKSTPNQNKTSQQLRVKPLAGLRSWGDREKQVLMGHPDMGRPRAFLRMLWLKQKKSGEWSLFEMGGLLLLNVSLADMEVQLHEDRKHACQHCAPTQQSPRLNK